MQSMACARNTHEKHDKDAFVSDTEAGSEKPHELSAFLTARSNDSSVDFVVNSIKELLLTKKVMPGDRLPSETELCKLLSVSRGSVREAMKILSALGIVEIRRGDGTYISRGGGKVAFDPLLFSLIVSQPHFAELKALRVILEKSVARLAAQNADEEDLRRLRDCLARTQSLKNAQGGNYEALLALDLEFHEILGNACRNRPLQTIYGFVMQYFRPYIAQSLHKQSDFSHESAQAHQLILRAIENRDGAAAEMAAEESNEIWESLMLKQ